KLVVVHGEGARRDLIESLRISDAHDSGVFDDRIRSVRLGEGERVSPEREADARRRVRARYGIPDEALVFGCFGGMTPEKRIPQVLAALRAILPHAPDARLMLSGAAASHYAMESDIAALWLGDRVIVTGYLATDDGLS